LAVVVGLMVFWMGKVKRIQRTLKRMERELAGEEIHFDRADPSSFYFGSKLSEEEEV
jgi:hypothetical protein